MRKITLLICASAYMLMGTLSVNAQWQEINDPGGRLWISLCVAVSDSNIFVGLGGSTGIALSTNNGNSWTAINNGLLITRNGESFYPSIFALAISGANIFAGTSWGVFLSTNNGGNWTLIDNGLTIMNDTPEVFSLAISGANIFAGTDEGVFLSTNNGSNWTPANTGLPDSIWVNTLTISGSNIFAGTGSPYIGGGGGGVFISTNNGSNWTPANTGLPDSIWVNTLAISGSNIFAGTYSNGIFLSTNNGDKWTAVNNGLTLFPDTIVNTLAVSGSNIFVGTGEFRGGGVFLSTNNGSSWTEVDSGITNLTNGSIGSIAISGTDIWAVQDSNGLWHRSLSNILGVENITADNYSIGIYPNPATNQLTIQTSSLHTNQAVTVSIMNVLGQEVASYSLSFDPGRGEAIDVSKLSAGICFVQMKSESGSVVKRFVKE